MSRFVRYGLIFFLLLSSFISTFCQERKIVFPITIVIFSGIDTIFCFEDSLSEKIKLIPINSELEYVEFVNKKLQSVDKIDTSLFLAMIRFYAVMSESFGDEKLAWNRVFDYDAKTKRKIGFQYRDENSDRKNYLILRSIIKKRLNK